MAKKKLKIVKKVKPVRQAQAKTSSSNSRPGITPLGDRVLVRPYLAGEEGDIKKNDYGIIIPDTVSKEKSAQGKVLAVGEGRYDDGVLVPMRVKVGDVVIFSKYGYDEVEQNGEELYLLKEDNILAVIK